MGSAASFCGSATRNAGSPTSVNTVVAIKPGKSEDSDEEESDRDAEVDAEFERQLEAGCRKRGAVAAESTDVGTAAEWVKPKYDKTEEASTRILEICRTNPKLKLLFGDLKEESMQDVISAFEEVTLSEGENVIVQGDMGDALYILNDGSVDVFQGGSAPPSDKGPKVATLGSGALFGELALMYNAPRNATVTVASPDSKVWRLMREPFSRLRCQQFQEQHKLYESWLQEVDLFKSMSGVELQRLSDCLKSKEVSSGDYIIKQGDIGDRFYILERGKCGAFVEGKGADKVVQEYSARGDYFGELALLKDAPRVCSVKATGEGVTTVLYLTKEQFTTCLGPVKDVLKAKASFYQRISQLGL